MNLEQQMLIKMEASHYLIKLFSTDTEKLVKNLSSRLEDS